MPGPLDAYPEYHHQQQHSQSSDAEAFNAVTQSCIQISNTQQSLVQHLAHLQQKQQPVAAINYDSQFAQISDQLTRGFNSQAEQINQLRDQLAHTQRELAELKSRPVVHAGLTKEDLIAVVNPSFYDIAAGVTKLLQQQSNSGPDVVDFLQHAFTQAAASRKRPSPQQPQQEQQDTSNKRARVLETQSSSSSSSQPTQAVQQQQQTVALPVITLPPPAVATVTAPVARSSTQSSSAASSARNSFAPRKSS